MKIEYLLNKYFDGVSTPQEETELREYFFKADINPEFERYRSLFSFINAESAQSIDLPDFDDNIIRQIKSNESKLKNSRVLNTWVISSVAASFIIIFCFILLNSQKNTNVEIKPIAKDHNVISKSLNSIAKASDIDIVYTKIKSNKRNKVKNIHTSQSFSKVTLSNPLKGFDEAMTFISIKLDMIDTRIDSAMAMMKL